MKVIEVKQGETVFQPFDGNVPTCRRCNTCGYHVVSGECTGVGPDGVATISDGFNPVIYTSYCDIQTLVRRG